MKVVLLLCLAGVALASPKPGGYIAKGGVFDFKRTLDYLEAGKAAGKFAWNKKFESELSGEDVVRGDRSAPEYIPTFFTSQQNHEALTAARNPRPQRQVDSQEPLYYETYHNKRSAPEYRLHKRGARPDAPPAYGPPTPYHAPAKLPPQPFSYQYGVADDYSGANYEKAENQDASGNLQGSYRVNLPDGRVQIVTYTADHQNGFIADVKYEGTAVYPEEKPYAPAPKYAPAPPKYAPA